MAGEVYSIALKLDVDSSELDAALDRAKGAQSAGTRSSAGRYAGRSPRQAAAYRYRRAGLSEGQRGFMARMTRFSRGNPWFASVVGVGAAGKGLAGINRAYNRLNQNFASNLFTINGFRRNIGNFTNVIAQTGGALIKAVPVLSTLATGLGTFLAIKGLNLAVGGGTLLAGKKILMGNNLGEAARDLAQFQTARNFIGSEYNKTYRRATEIAETYGFDRAGIINTASVLSQLRLNGRSPLGIDVGLNVAEIMGKIAQYSNADYNRIARNMQQLLARPVPSGRDINELITQAPIVSTVTQRQMLNKTGNVGGILEYFKSKDNILDVLYAVGNDIKTHPITQLRGQIGLSKQNLWMSIAENGGAFFKDVSDAVVKFNGMLEATITRYASQYKPGALNNLFDDVISGVQAILDGAVGFVKKIAPALTWANDNIWTLSLGLVGLKSGNPFIAGAALLAGLALDTKGKDKKKIFEYYEGVQLPKAARAQFEAAALERAAELGAPVQSKPVMRGSDVVTVRTPYSQQPEAVRAIADSIQRANPQVLKQIKNDLRGNTEWGKSHTYVGTNWFGKDDESPRYHAFSQGQVPKIPGTGTYETGEYLNMLRIGRDDSLTTPDTDTADDYKSLLQSMAGERRSLTINFNREIVSMSTSVTATDAANIAEQVRPVIEDAVTSGLHRALAYATAMN